MVEMLRLKKLPTMINGNAEITPSRIACKCLCSESLAIGPDKFYQET